MAIIQQFIKDFDMDNEHGIICFDAVVEFSGKGIFKKFPTEVHIHMVLQLYFVYLLDKEVRRFELPDKFACNERHLSYEKSRALIINLPKDKQENYTLKLYPDGNGCKPYTVQELRQKVYN